MTNNEFMNLYWKQYLMIEKEFRNSFLYVSFSIDNADAYSDFFAKVILEIGSEVDVVAKKLCKELNNTSRAENIMDYGKELIQVYPEIENVTIKCNAWLIKPWKDWNVASPIWWRIYNGVKHRRSDIETYDGITQENYKFSTLKCVTNALAGLFLLENYLYLHVVDANPNIDTPIPGSRLFKAIEQGWD
jgi:hypothetical protein